MDEQKQGENPTDGLVETLGKILSPLGYDAVRIQNEINHRRAAIARHNERAKARNLRTCRLAVGREITIRTTTGRITGVIQTCEVDGRVFRVTILQSGQYLQGPYYVKKVPG